MTTSAAGPTARFRIGWMIVFGVSVLLALAALYILVVPVSPDDFESTTGVVWDRFSTEEPAVADYLEREARLLGLGYFGMSLFAAIITWTRLRRGDSRGARLLWIFPVVLGLGSIVFFAGDGAGLGVFYGVAALVVSGGLILAQRAITADPNASG